MKTFLQQEKIWIILGVITSLLLMVFLGMARTGWYYAPLLSVHRLITWGLFILLFGILATLWFKISPKLHPAFIFMSLNIAFTGLIVFSGVTLNRLWIIIPYALLITLAGFKSIRRRRVLWAGLTLFFGGVIITWVVPSLFYGILIGLYSALAILYVFNDIYMPRVIALVSLVIPVLFIVLLTVLGASQIFPFASNDQTLELYGGVPNDTLTVSASLESVFIDSSLWVDVYQNVRWGFVREVGSGVYPNQFMLPTLEASDFTITQDGGTYQLQLFDLDPPISFQLD